jgi:cysteine desulfurase
MIYLDYNATTPLASEVLEAMRPYLELHFGNPSSIHRSGRESRAGIDDARDLLATVLHARPHELVFTSGGTESVNLGVIGLARSRAAIGRHVITSPTEHHAVLHAVEFLERNEGFRVTRLAVDSTGRVDPAELKRELTDKTALVSIMSANNETGTLQPIAELAAICRTHGVPFHSDMIQSCGKSRLDVRDAGPDAISIAAHKFHGPKGAGALWLRAGLPIERIQYGGSHENERRPGTENPAAIVGMARAAEIFAANPEAESSRQAELRDALWNEVRAAFPGAVMNGDPEHRLANTLNVSFPGLDAETMLINLDLEGVCASSGSACMVGSIVPSHVLLAMGVTPDLARATVRFSLGHETTREEIRETGAILRQLAARLALDA